VPLPVLSLTLYSLRRVISVRHVQHPVDTISHRIPPNDHLYFFYLWKIEFDLHSPNRYVCRFVHKNAIIAQEVITCHLMESLQKQSQKNYKMKRSEEHTSELQSR